MRLDRSFFEKDTVSVAKSLLGKTLVRVLDNKEVKFKIVEVEAYLDSKDTASHARFGITKRNLQMFMDPGNIYVYFIYGMYYCLNIVTEEKGLAGGVLIRALEPLSCELSTNGPGKLCRTLKIDLSMNGTSIFDKKSDLYILEDKNNVEILSSFRIGVKNDIETPLRFFIKDNKFVSKNI